ncbi:efflux RND transporter permease subunit [Anaerosacchariphilus sp. NSJ-68]|uniref:Efflux RND transporter permease subunit n=2 Tax=Lachnospiraceae TaxID=186803 RepID=A0A923RMM9_9FIRM|nr:MULTISPECIES: efflux RND transporter permease subunit [Lachnospiraceae]MBC5658570.1 efflux RND transporter permease subunit [Anaerosacchariphilus hominis]MBC5698221.1 efflux RND transporter permease subunit [Roseburia difficilis]
MNLTKFSLKRPVTTLLVVLALAVFGISSLLGLRLELMPDMDMPVMMVMTIYPGADPESVEELVSSEIEGKVGALSGVDSVTTYSQENSSMVLLQYDYSVDTNDAYLDLRAALDSVERSLPDDCQSPIVMKMDINSMPSMMYSLSTTDGSDVLSLANDEIVPELKAVSSVASVEVSGGRENYIQVKLDEEAMNQYGLTMSSIAQYIATTDFTVPIGSLEQGTQSISAISTADVTTVEDLREIPLFTATGSLIHLSDVADVQWSQKEPDSISRYNGEETLTVSVTKNQSASTLGVVRDVRKTMERLQKEHPGLVATASYDASDMILLAVKSVGSTLLMGVILSMLVLFIFFGDWKASLIVGSAMPISLLVTVIVMAVAGFSLNIITLGALVIAIGMMVDSSSVVLESCFRAKDKKPGFREAAEIGTRGVAGSIVASTITTVVVYLPLCIQTGLTGQIFGQLGYTIIIAMLASLISALTLVPLFFCIFKPQEKKERKLNGFLDKVKGKYDRLERKLLHKKKLSVLVAVVLLIGSFGLVALMKVELMPAMDEGTISVAAAFRSGTKAEEVDKKMQEIEAMVAAHEDVDSYTLTSSKGSGKISVNLKEDRRMSSQEVADEWLEETKDMTGVQLDITVSSQMSTMMLTSSGGSVTLASTNLDDLKEAVSALQEKAWNIPGVLNVSSDAGEGSTQIRVVIDPLDAMAHGMTPIQAAGGLYSMISGTEAMTITSNGEEYSVMLEYPEGTYTKASSLLDASVGGVPLSEMATLQYTDSQQTVMKQNGKYTTTITASCVSEDTDAVDAALDKLVADTKLPDSVEQTKDTMDEMMTETFTAIGKAIAAAVFLVFLVMAMQFESPKYSLMVMLSIPFSLIGSFGLLFLSGQSLTMISMMGIMMLVGIVVNNGILYVDGVHALMNEEGLGLEDALIESGKTRLRPILITTLTTVISMIPMSLGLGTGTEMMQSMGIIIIGGLTASTILILLLMPVFYLMAYGNKKEKGPKKPRKWRLRKHGAAETEVNA